MQPVPFPWEGSRPERTNIRTLAVWLTLNQALLLELLRARHIRAGYRVHHPKDQLEVCGEINIFIGGQHSIHPIGDHLDKVRVLHKPGGIEGEGEGSLVCLVVPSEVVVQQSSQVGLLLHIRATAHQLAAGQLLVKGGVLPSIQLIYNQFPEWKWFRWASAQCVIVGMARVWDVVVEGVRPDWYGARGAVIEES